MIINQVRIKKNTDSKSAPASYRSLKFKSSLQVSALVKFYLEKNFGDASAIVHLDRTTTVGKYFYKCIENPSNHLNKRQQGHALVTNLNKCSVIIELSESCFMNNGVLVSATDQVEFNTFITKLIYQAVWLYIDARIDNDKKHYSVRKLMEDFCIKYGYDEATLSYERLKKARQYTENTDKGLNIC